MSESRLTDHQQSQLLIEIHHLRQEIEQLRQDRQDLQIALATTAEHGDLMEAQLQAINHRLAAEVKERQRAESLLQGLLEILSSERSDLEIVVETLMQHGDCVDNQWREKLHQANRLVKLDGLTQISNRRGFDEYFEQQWKQMLREQLPLSLLLCDIDFFKQFNDTYGHPMGDTCLRRVAGAIDRTLQRPSDMAARYGGEEFIVILPQTSSAGARTVADRMQLELQRLQIPHARSSIGEFVTMSIGIATMVPTGTESRTMLLEKVDRCLYLAKQRGRNQVA
jgi:diguanylate cyclase (GGDEF)-like protein